MIKVQVRSNEPLEAALRRFKRQCNYAGIFRLAKKHSFHEKTSDKRRRERREKERSIQRLLKKANERGRPRRAGRKSRVKGGREEPAENTALSDTGPAKPKAPAADAGEGAKPAAEATTSAATSTES